MGDSICSFFFCKQNNTTKNNDNMQNKPNGAKTKKTLYKLSLKIQKQDLLRKHEIAGIVFWYCSTYVCMLDGILGR